MKIKLLKNNRNNFLLLFVSSLFFLIIMSASAQMRNNGIFYIASGGTVFVNNGDVSFGNFSQITTSKGSVYDVTDGKLLLGTDASFLSDGTDLKYVNGYAGTTSLNQKILAIGSNGIFAPIKVESNPNVSNVHGAYFNVPPLSLFAGVGPSVVEISNTEYWIVKGENSFLSLSWRPTSNLGLITSNPLNNLTIVGYKNGQWEVIPSFFNTNSVFTGQLSSLNGYGSITSHNPVVLNDYSAFAIGKISNLSNEDFVLNNFYAFIDKSILQIESSENIENVTVFDLTGKSIVSYSNDSVSSVLSIPFYHAAGVYILLTKLNNGQTITKKIINK